MDPRKPHVRDPRPDGSGTKLGGLMAQEGGGENRSEGINRIKSISKLVNFGASAFPTEAVFSFSPELVNPRSTIGQLRLRRGLLSKPVNTRIGGATGLNSS